jgi:hypothetical protein
VVVEWWFCDANKAEILVEKTYYERIAVGSEAVYKAVVWE